MEKAFLSAYIEKVVRCPICETSFQMNKNSLKCLNGHCFDYSSDGYLHLLPSSQMHKKVPGDSKEMMSARHFFLEKGYYDKLKKGICSYIDEEFFQKELGFLDIGCGEGYYTQGMIEVNSPKSKQGIGIDISKFGLRYAGKRFKNNASDIAFFVASAYHLPLCDQSFQLVTNIFSPLSLTEIHRVLCKEGVFLYVIPNARHLWQLKEIVYETPYENKVEITEYEGFILEKEIIVEDKIFLNCSEDIKTLFAMTPYFWKSPKAGVERLYARTTLETEISFRILIYRKKD